MIINTKNTVFVFDLDDTLYKESDYHVSGINAVCELVKKIYHIELDGFFEDVILRGEKDLWLSLCLHLKIPIEVKNSLIWTYRLHAPNIGLSDNVIDLINFIRLNAAGLAILTDGRSISQRLKCSSLGLSDIPIFISEEFDAPKPYTNRFKIIQDANPNCQHIYIGDNPKKDFLTPNQLGWLTIGLRGDLTNIHSQITTDLDASYLPHCWVSSFSDIKNFLI